MNSASSIGKRRPEASSVTSRSAALRPGISGGRTAAVIDARTSLKTF